MAGLAVVVTVYNLEKYIEKCLQSILSQTYKDIEVIVVDDGSTDNSGILCEKIASADCRIKVIHQENAGRVIARNTGVKNSNAEYITFVDGDDWIDQNMYENMMANVVHTGADLIVSGMIETQNGNYSKKYNSLEPGIYRSDGEMKFLRQNWFCYKGKDEFGAYSPVWAKIYRKRLIEEILELIPFNLYRGEDLLFNGIYISRCKSVSVMQEAYYYYRLHEESTVNRKCPELYSQIGYVQETLARVYKNEAEVFNAVIIRNFLNFIMLWNAEYESDLLHIPYYTFDYSWIGGRSVALYGAGMVGKDYYWILKRTNPKALRIWVDKNYSVAKEKGLDVHEIDVLKEHNYDVVLIAVESEQVANQIKEELINDFGIYEENIIWNKPNHCWI